MIQEIKEIEQILQLKFNLRMTWVDARLDFYNIKLKETMNVISIDELNKIWLPKIIFHNTERGQRTINDDESFATINILALSVMHIVSEPLVQMICILCTRTKSCYEISFKFSFSLHSYI